MSCWAKSLHMKITWQPMLSQKKEREKYKWPRWTRSLWLEVLNGLLHLLCNNSYQSPASAHLSLSLRRGCKNPRVVIEVPLGVCAQVAAATSANAGSRWWAVYGPHCPTPAPLSASISLWDPQWGSRCPVPTLPCSLCLHSTAQNLLQIKWIKKDLKVAPTSSVGGWDLLRARAMTIDGQNLLLVAYFGLPPPPLLLLVSLFSTRPCTPKLYIYQKLALWLTIPVLKKKDE